MGLSKQKRLRKRNLFVLLMSLTTSFFANAEIIDLPVNSEDKHLGIVSCSGSTCHGAVEPLVESPILQNEFFTWHRKDEHSKAYDHLKNDLSKRIAKNLKLKKPAHESKVCLDCHADNVPLEKRGKRFQISDGVTCESCHGGSKRWIGTHISGEDSHEVNLQNGLYPTEDPVHRARLCLSCHFGTKDKFVTHEIMGAGHPRLSFELDTFTATQPAHYKIDSDYHKRKIVADGTQVWAIGQAVAVGLYLDKISSESGLGAAGLFPELSLFDCQSCHHAMKDKKWTGHVGLKPGKVRFNDGNFVLLRHALTILHPNWSMKYSGALLALHKATTVGKEATKTAAESIRNITVNLVDAFSQHRFNDNEKRQLLNSIADEAIAGRQADYIVAEQSLMALDAISRSISDKAESKRLVKAILPMYQLFGDVKAIADKDNPNYSSAKFIQLMSQFKSKL